MQARVLAVWLLVVSHAAAGVAQSRVDWAMMRLDPERRINLAADTPEKVEKTSAADYRRMLPSEQLGFLWTAICLDKLGWRHQTWVEFAAATGAECAKQFAKLVVEKMPIIPVALTTPGPEFDKVLLALGGRGDAGVDTWEIVRATGWCAAMASGMALDSPKHAWGLVLLSPDDEGSAGPIRNVDPSVRPERLDDIVKLFVSAQHGSANARELRVALAPVVWLHGPAEHREAASWEVLRGRDEATTLAVLQSLMDRVVVGEEKPVEDCLSICTRKKVLVAIEALLARRRIMPGYQAWLRERASSGCSLSRRMLVPR